MDGFAAIVALIAVAAGIAVLDRARGARPSGHGGGNRFDGHEVDGDD